MLFLTITNTALLGHPPPVCLRPPSVHFSAPYSSHPHHHLHKFTGCLLWILFLSFSLVVLMLTPMPGSLHMLLLLS